MKMLLIFSYYFITRVYPEIRIFVPDQGTAREKNNRRHMVDMLRIIF